MHHSCRLPSKGNPGRQLRTHQSDYILKQGANILFRNPDHALYTTKKTDNKNDECYLGNEESLCVSLTSQIIGRQSFM